MAATRTATIDRRAVMVRAWAIFGETYLFPRIKFSKIGRKCFGSCLRRAWAEVRKAAAAAAQSQEARAARIVELQDTVRFAPLTDSWRQASREISATRSELAALGAL